jgi:DNA-binding transcriptional MerR regulator
VAGFLQWCLGPPTAVDGLRSSRRERYVVQMAIDTLRIAKRLREAGFTDPQAEAVVSAVQEAAEGAEFATKRDVDELRAELKADIREAELRIETKIEALRSDIQVIKAGILSRVFGQILGALIVNIIAMIGAVFAVAKLLGH